MKKNIIISIIIPCFNDGQYLQDAINSAEVYSGGDSEIIIVNDGSTDEKTLSIFKDLEHKGYFIIEQENLGLSSARNNAIKIAKGQYILPLDSDVKIKPEYITHSIAILENNPEIGIVYSDVEFFDEEAGEQNIDDFDIHQLIVANYISAFAVYRKQVWIDVNGYDEKLNHLFGEDWEFWLNAHKKGWEFYHIPEVLYQYRKKSGSLDNHAVIWEEKKKVQDYILFTKHSDLFYSEYRKLLWKNLQTNRFETKLFYENKNIINDLQYQIYSIRRSITWNIISKINQFTTFIFPQHTKRRRLLDFIIRGLIVLVNDGWISFFKSIKQNGFSAKYSIEHDEPFFMRNEKKSKSNYRNIIKQINSFKYKPKISIIMPTWNTPHKVLETAVKSVQDQIYQNWELCIADGNSRSETTHALKKFAKNDSRIKINYLKKNLNISENSNQAILLASGEYIGLLDHDDELTNDALYEVVKLLQEHPEADLIYSDEDKIDENGNRSSFFFKPDWSPDLLLSQNYISHFGVYRKSIVDKIGGFRIGYDGSQDYDLVLRFSEQTKHIFHIPKILYHWRMIEGSLSKDSEAKGYAYDSARESLKDAMRRRGIPIEKIENTQFPGHYRVKYKLEDNDKVSIIIPTKDNLYLLQRCIDSIFQKTRYQNYEILIINNQSIDLNVLEYFQMIKENRKIRIIDYNEKFNYSAMNNFAVKSINSKYLLFLNDDTEIISQGWIKAMLEHCQKETTGAVGAKLLYPDNRIQHAGVILFSKTLIGHSHKGLSENDSGYFARVHITHNTSAVTGACLMVKRDHFREVGGFDEQNLKVMFNDVDLCLKLMKLGLLNIYTPFAKLYHYESYSRGYNISSELQEEIDYFMNKWSHLIGKDPYYNQNLVLDKEDFSLRI